MLAAYSPEASRDILIALAAIILLAFVLASIGVILYRMTTKRGAGDPFTLIELRRMRREGKITEQEFEQAKSAIIVRGRAQLDKDQSTCEPESPSDKSTGPADNKSDHSDNGRIS